MTPDSLSMARLASEAGAQLDPKAVINLLDHIKKLERIADRVAGMGEAYRESDGSHYSAHNHLVDYQLWEDARALAPTSSQDQGEKK